MLRDRSLIPLSHQHHNGLALSVLSRRALAAAPSPSEIVALAKRIIDRYEIELINHFELEEEILFPACEQLPIIEELIADHRSMEAIVRSLREHPTVDLIEQFCALITAHIRREESELFEQAQRTIPREKLDQIGAQLEARVVRICL